MKQQETLHMRKKVLKHVVRTVVKDWRLYVLLLPMMVWFAIWAYKPMNGLIIAFKRFDPGQGIMASEFVGLMNFQNLIAGINKLEFWQAFRNTFVISLYSLLFGFPIPILLALLFSEIGSNGVRKLAQTLTYLPHFLSEVTITGIVLMLMYNGVESTGVIARLLISTGLVDGSTSLMQQSNLFRPLFIITGIWKESGYNSIVYFAAIMGISPSLYEALRVDGGNKLQELRYVTFPGMAPTIILMVIMRIGNLLSVGYERVLLLYNANIYTTADVLSTFEQRFGILQANYGIGAASSLFNAMIAFALVLGANTISRNISKTSLW